MRNERNFWMPRIALDPCSREPLYLQLSRQLAEAIRGEAFQNARLPSTRSLAKWLGTSRNTVLAAYEVLAADGWICGTRGSGTRVQARSNISGARALGLRRILRDARYPARIVSIADPDGNPLYLNF